MSDTRHIAIRAINWGLGCNILLALVKTSIGLLSGSDGLFADGINSTSDVVYYLVVKALVRFAHHPPDREHPYGHRQLESIAALAVGSFIVTTAVVLFWMAVNRLYTLLTQSGQARVDIQALWVALATIVLKATLTLYTRVAAKRTGNAAILALARDHRNDIVTAMGAAVGIALSRMGYGWSDPLVAIGVAGVVLATGIQILRESSTDLMDAVPSEALDRQTREALRGVPGLRTVEEVQAHRFGPYFILNVAIGVDAAATVRDGDRIASSVERRLYSELPLVQRVYVHYHPAGEALGDQNSP